MDERYKIKNYSAIFNEDFDDELDEKILNDIQYCKSLYFGHCFNQSIDNLPYGIEILILGSEFNKPIDNLPDGLKYLFYYGWQFDNNIDFLPNNLKVLTLYGNFDKTIDCLPPKLERLELGFNFNKPLDNLPQYLQELIILNLNYEFDLLNIPKSIKRLKISKNYVGKIRDGITIEYFYKKSYPPLNLSTKCKVDSFCTL